jgi:AcrR family transcriptional regulator
MSETKERIRNVAENLFFEHGIANTRLQLIADEAGISVGNLAYHFKNKEALVVYVYEHLFEEFNNILITYLQTPDLTDFDRQFEALYKFFSQNSFYLNNIWEIERNFPDIKEKWHQLNQKILLQIKKRLEFNTKRGVLAPEPYPNAYEMLAQNLWMTLNSWLPQQILLKRKASFPLYRKALWSQIYPFLTAKGRKEFEVSVDVPF